MIEINEKNNYLEIIDSRDLSNLKTAYYPKKDTTINVFYLPKEEHTELNPAPIEGGFNAGGDDPIILVPDPVAIGGDDPIILVPDPVAIGGDDPIILVPDPVAIGGDDPIILAPDPVVIGNIEIKRNGGTTVIDKNSFVNLQVFIDGRATDFTACVDFLTLNTAI